MQLSDKEILKIKKDYKKFSSLKKTAEKNGVSVYMVKKVVSQTKSTTTSNIKQKDKNSDVEGYMELKREDALNFIGKCLDTMASDEKLTGAPINQIASAMGVVMDKFTAKKDKDAGSLDDILKAVKNIE